MNAIIRRRPSGEKYRKDLLTLARIIERLAPGAGSKTHPENVEYPWFDASEKIISPLDYPYLGIDEDSRVFLSFIKLVLSTARDLAPY